MASPAQAEGTWGQATEVTAPANAGGNPSAVFLAISCSSAGNCTATGDYENNSGNFQAMAATETAGAWAQATEVTSPANAKSSGLELAYLYRVSCSSAGNCTATGDYDDNSGNFQAMAATETAGTWSQATEVTAPTNAGGDPEASLVGISCSSAGNCTATGNYEDNSGNFQAMAASETAGTWGQATEVAAPTNAGGDPEASLAGVWCSSVGNCTAAGDYVDNSGNGQLMAAIESSGTWGQATEITAPANAKSNPSGFLDGISCSSTGNCTAAGGYRDSSGNAQAMTASESSGTWGQATEVTAPVNAGSDPGASLGGISCASLGNCTAAGDYDNSSGDIQAMAVTETAGTWGQATEVTAPVNAGSDPDAGFTGISCTAIGNCTAAGDYTDDSGNGQLMVASEPVYSPPISRASSGSTSFAVPQPDGAPSVFCKGPGGSLWNYWYVGGTWDGAELTSSGVASIPVAVLQPDGSPSVFYEGTGGSLVNYWYVNGIWDHSVVTASGVNSHPVALLQPDGSPSVFFQGPDNSLLNYWYNAGTWGSATVAGVGSAYGVPAAVTQLDGSPSVFFQGPANSLLNYWYNAGAWGSATVAGAGSAYS